MVTRTRMVPSVALSAFIGFIVIFAACAAGWDYFTAGREKYGADVWTGSKAGTAIDGFLKGANAKAVKSAQNPNPEVMPVVRHLNSSLFAKHEKLFSWLVTLGELLMPIGVLFFLIVKFPSSRWFLILIAGLAAFVNYLYLSEGVSSTNPQMSFMWLAILWLAAALPGAALFYAIDLGRLGRRQEVSVEEAAQDDAAAPARAGNLTVQWVFYALVLFVMLAAAWAEYDYPVFFGAILASILIAAVLYALKMAVPGRERQSMPVPYAE